MFDNELKR